MERSAKLASAFGWEITPAKIFNSVWPVAIMAGGMIWQRVPWYVTLPVAIFMVGSLLHLYAGISRALAVQGIKNVSLVDAAAACERVERGFYDFIEARSEEVSQVTSIVRPPEGVDWSKFHEGIQAQEQDLMRRLRSRIGSDVAAAVALLNSLDVPAESDLRSLHWADSLARYYGAVGKLLRGGHLKEAKSLDRHKLFF